MKMYVLAILAITTMVALAATEIDGDNTDGDCYEAGDIVCNNYKYVENDDEDAKPLDWMRDPDQDDSARFCCAKKGETDDCINCCKHDGWSSSLYDENAEIELSDEDWEGCGEDWSDDWTKIKDDEEGEQECTDIPIKKMDKGSFLPGTWVADGANKDSDGNTIQQTKNVGYVTSIKPKAGIRCLGMMTW